MSETVVALATTHGKLEQIAPAFERLPDWRIVVADIDTDQFGTFSGEIERVLSPRETAIAKARAGMAAAGTAFGLASEGSIRPHPTVPRTDIFGCVQCPSTRVVARLEQFADPARCDVCNP